MQIEAIFLVILSAVMHALRNYLNKGALDKHAFVWWYEIFGLIFFTPVFLSVLLQECTAISFSLTFILLSGLIHFIYWIFLCHALEHGELSLVYPIMRSSPALVLVFSVIFLEEDVSFPGIGGILLVAAGVYTIGMDRFCWRSVFLPFASVTRDRGIQFAFLTLFSVAAYSLVDKMAVDSMNPVLFAYLYPWISMSLFSVYLYRTKARGVLKNEWFAHKRAILFCGVLSIFGYFFILLAFTMAPVSYVVGLRQLSIVFAVLMGGHFLKERNRPIRLFSATIIFAGAYLIAIAG